MIPTDACGIKSDAEELEREETMLTEKVIWMDAIAWKSGTLCTPMTFPHRSMSLHTIQYLVKLK